MDSPTPKEDPRRTEGIRSRHPETLEAIVRENVDALTRVARAAGLNADDALDAVQETLLVFVERADRFDGRATARTWLFGILYNKIRERRRAFWRETATDEPDTFMAERFDSTGRWTKPVALPDSRVAAAQAMGWLDRCIGRLNDRQRSAFVLREVEQMETDELCNILDVTRNNLGVILFRARNALRECLEHHGLGGPDDVAV